MSELMHLVVWAGVVWAVGRVVWWSTDLPGKPLDYLLGRGPAAPDRYLTDEEVAELEAALDGIDEAEVYRDWQRIDEACERQ